MKTSLIFFSLILVVAAAGMFMLGSDRGGPAAAIVPFTTLAEGLQSKVPSRVNYLITTQAELAELWKLIEEPAPVPKVDFTTNVIAAVFAGEAPTAGYAIAVAKVEDADSRVVKVEITKPDGSCILAQSLTAPYQIIELQKTSLPFTHADTLVTKVCE